MAIYKKKLPLNFKKIPRYLALTLLTAGASLILGFLSFGGMYALLPILPLAFATFGLSVAYEGEIYLQNIKGAFKKLFKSSYLEHHLAKDYLLKNVPEDTDDDHCPEFFKDYKALLEQLSQFHHKQLDKESRKKKKEIEKTLADMEKWFALQLFAAKKNEAEEPSEYTLRLREWLAAHEQKEWQSRLEERKSIFNWVKGFSTLAALFMGLGSTYLIVETFTIIPFFASISFAFWPFMIVPMAIVSGAAYGMLTYNTITDLISNDTIRKWYNKLRDDLSQGLTVRNVFMAATAVFLIGLAVALTICTAGTWWTVATHARPLFEWMGKIPSFIMGIINPIITGLSAISFNLQNSAESLEMVDEATRSKKSIFKRIYEYVTEGWAHLRATENPLQIINLPRLFLKLTLTPLRLLLFMGHLVSIALTSDRMPGLPQIISVMVGIISEGFEDAHYFVGHDDDEQPALRDQNEPNKTQALLEQRLGNETDHDQGTDIPTRLLIFIASPIYFLAAVWDCWASKLNKPLAQNSLEDGMQRDTERKSGVSVRVDEESPRTPLSFTQAWNKQLGIKEEEHVSLDQKAKQPSQKWNVEHTVFLIDTYEKKHLEQAKIGTGLAKEKSDEFQKLKKKIRESDGASLSEILSKEKNNKVYNQHRLFSLYEGEKTATQEFIEELPERVMGLA